LSSAVALAQNLPMTRAALLGFGLAGRYLHAPLLQAAGIEVAAVVSSKHEEIAQVLPRARVLAKDIDAFAADDIDLIVVATPHQLHVPQARAALTAGKHVVVDKPMCIRTEEGDALIALATQHSRMLTAFHNRRWDGDFLTLRKLIAGGRLGEITSYDARWNRFRPTLAERWQDSDRPGNGILHDLGTHLLDQMLTLFGLPDWIHAQVVTQRAGARANDAFSIQMSARNVVITVGGSLLIADGGPRYGIHGTKGSYLKYGLDQQEAQLRGGLSPLDAAFGSEPESQWGRFTDGATSTSEVIPSERGRWTEFYARVRTCIENGNAPPVSAESARDVIRVIEAAVRSSATGQRVTL
jgi:scyllo-inositol 2-dehydrogenase (NADP+)